MADIDGWHARDLIAPLFFNDNTELHNLIRKRLILPYLTGSFHPSFIIQYERTSDGSTETGSLQNREVFTPSYVERSDVAASLVVNATPVRNEEAKLFTST